MVNKKTIKQKILDLIQDRIDMTRVSINTEVSYIKAIDMQKDELKRLKEEIENLK